MEQRGKRLRGDKSGHKDRDAENLPSRHPESHREVLCISERATARDGDVHREVLCQRWTGRRRGCWTPKGEMIAGDRGEYVGAFRTK